MTSTYDIWADLYDVVYSHLVNDVSFYTKEALKSTGPVLELGCGTGRITLPIAQSGLRIVGLDNSDSMLSVARRKTEQPPHLPVTLLADDMRTFSIGQRFPLIIIPFAGFCSLTDPVDQLSTLKQIRRHLSPHGKLILDMPVADPYASRQGNIPYHFRNVSDSPSGRRFQIWQFTNYAFHDQISNNSLLIEEIEKGTIAQRWHKYFPLRLTNRWEMHHLLETCQFKIEELYGDFNYNPFSDTSENMIWIASATC